MSQANLSDASMAQRAYSNQAQNSSGSSTSVDELYSKYGSANVEQAVMNFVAEYLKKALTSMVEQLPMPQFQKDQAMQALNQAVQGASGQVPSGAQEGVQQYASDGQSSGGGKSSGGASGGGSSDLMSGVMKMLQDSMQEETSNASSQGAGGRSGGGGNWLAVLARALGKTAGEHLKKMVELGEKMGGLDSKEQASEFAETQAEFQAESQIFKMFQEAIGTMVKSIGEGMSTVARKQ